MQRSHLVAFVVGTPIAVGLLSATVFWWETSPPAMPEPIVAPASAPAPMPATTPAPRADTPTRVPAVDTTTTNTVEPAAGRPMLDPTPTLDPVGIDPTPGGSPPPATPDTRPASGDLAREPLPE